MAIRTYRADDVQIIINGIIVDGLAQETFVAVEFANPVALVTVSPTGNDATVATNLDRRATVTVTLQQTSPAHRSLISMYNNYIAGNEGGVGSLLLKAPNGDGAFDSYNAEQIFIEDLPTFEYASDQTNREWTLITPRLTIELGT